MRLMFFQRQGTKFAWLACMKQCTKVCIRVGILLWGTSALLYLVGCTQESTKTEEPGHITLHLAASLSDVVQELGRSFSARHDVSVYYNIAGSGALAQQILAAPRGDLYLSANNSWLEKTVEAGRIEGSSVRQIATNQLAVIASVGSDYDLSSPEDLCHLEIRHLCIGNPDHVPAGDYAKAWLQRVNCGSLNSWMILQEKILPAIDVRAAMEQTLATDKSIGIVYNTDYLLRRSELQRLYLVPTEAAPLIAYYAGILATSEQPHHAQAFLDFLASPEGQAIIKRYGFGVPARGSAYLSDVTDTQ
jgi:molybdate transport system substrate-binding protein